MILSAIACILAASVAGFVFGWLAHGSERADVSVCMYWRMKYETLEGSRKRLHEAYKDDSKVGSTRR